MVGKQKTQNNEQTKENKQDDFETVAIVKVMNVYDTEKGEYTDEINQKSVKVETFVKDIKNEKPELIGYILVSSMEKFVNGEINALPIKKPKPNN